MMINDGELSPHSAPESHVLNRTKKLPPCWKSYLLNPLKKWCWDYVRLVYGCSLHNKEELKFDSCSVVQRVVESKDETTRVKSQHLMRKQIPLWRTGLQVHRRKNTRCAGGIHVAMVLAGHNPRGLQSCWPDPRKWVTCCHVREEYTLIGVNIANHDHQGPANPPWLDPPKWVTLTLSCMWRAHFIWYVCSWSRSPMTSRYSLTWSTKMGDTLS